MSFRTNHKIIDNTIGEFSFTAKAMESYADRLGKVRVAINATGLPRGISDSIGSRVTAVSTVAAGLTGVKQCFEEIGAVYLSGEREVYRIMSGNRSFAGGKIIPTGAIIGVAATSPLSKWRVPWRSIISVGFAFGKAIIPGNWPKVAWDRFKRLWEKIKERAGNKPSGITKEQELADDLRMKNEIQSILKSYESAWRRATTDAERMRLLNDFLAEIQRVMGTSAKTKISFRSLRAPEGYITYGGYAPFTKRITLNKKLLSEPEGIYLLTVLIHEARHAYQHEAAKSNKHTVSDETRQIWKDNLKRKNYKTSKRDGFDAYRDQPVERDARWFAGERV